MASFDAGKLKKLIIPGEVPNRMYKTSNVYEDEFQSYPSDIRSQYVFDGYTKTYTLPNKTWIQWRRHGPYWFNKAHKDYIPIGIGGSEVAILYGGSDIEDYFYFYKGAKGNTYKSNVELFYDKLDIAAPVMEAESKEEIFFAGHNLEESAIRDFEFLYKKDHPEDSIEIINDTSFIQCGRKDKKKNLLLPHCLINLDRIIKINGIPLIGECKICNYMSEDYPLWKSHIVPLKYRLQLAWYFIGCNLPGAFIVCKTGLLPSDTFYIFVERDFELEEFVISMVGEFVRSIEEAREPEVPECHKEKYYEFLRRQNAAYEPAVKIQLSDELSDVLLQGKVLCDKLTKTKNEIKRIEKQIRSFSGSQLEPIMGPYLNGSLKFSDGSYLEIKRSNPICARSINPDSVKAKFPDLYEKYKMERLNDALLKKEHPELLRDEEVLEPAKLSTANGMFSIKIKEAKQKNTSVSGGGVK